MNQDSSFTSVVVLQPITDLLKVREGVRIAKADEKCEPSQPFKKRGNADPMSFAFFIGIIVAVLLVPVAVRRREDVPTE